MFKSSLALQKLSTLTRLLGVVLWEVMMMLQRQQVNKEVSLLPFVVVTYQQRAGRLIEVGFLFYLG